MIDLWLLAHVLHDGPKIFRPTLDQCLAMEQLTPRIPARDYAQPYPAMVVELPEAYRASHTGAARSPLPQGLTHHAPACVLIGWPSPSVPVVWVSTVFDSGVRVRLSILPTDETLEDGIAREFGAEQYVQIGDLNPEERVILASVHRLAVNAMLLLVEFGCRQLGPANEGHFHRLQRYAGLARKRGRGVAEADRDLRLAPQLYGFVQEVELHEEAHESPADSGDGGGSHRRPHWRRGHWKTHAHGPGRSLRKRILIKPVLVNRPLLHEGEGPAQTVYRLVPANDERHETHEK